MKQPIKVVMLPTEDKTNVHCNKVKAEKGISYELSYHLELSKCGNTGLVAGNKHVYTISDEIINNKGIIEGCSIGDYVIVKGKVKQIHHIGKPFNFKGTLGFSIQENTDREYAESCRKIIATDDPKLTNCNKCKLGIRNEAGYHYDGQLVKHKCTSVPQVQQSFLKEFVANPDGEYEVKYEIAGSRGNTATPELFYKLKLNQDNTVNITAVEEKMMPMGKVLKLVEESNHFSYLQGVKIGKGQEVNGTFPIDEWLTKNL